MLDAQIRRGSVPPRFAARLARAQRRGRLQIVVGEIADARRDGAELVLTLGHRGALRCRRLALATGFAPDFERVPLLDTVAEALGLERGPLSLPLLDEQLRWHPRIHVVGSAARLSLGPLAANIAGARLAALRLDGLAAP